MPQTEPTQPGATTTARGGRPMGDARKRLEKALSFASADFARLADVTGLPVHTVRRTLNNMRTSRHVAPVGLVASPARRSRRALYGLCAADAGQPSAGRVLADVLGQGWR